MYRLPLKNIFNNKKVNNLVGEPCKRVSLKEAARPWLTAAVTVKAFTQVENDIINKKERELDKQYIAIKIDYRTKVFSKE